MFNQALLFVILLLCQVAQSQALNFYPSSSGEIIEHTYYKLSYIEAHEQPEWVAYYLAPEMLKKIVKRKGKFTPDSLVSTGSATYADYKAFPEYDAGHLLPCRQMQFDCTAMEETFYMSNMSPQQKDFNRTKWSWLENLERNMAWRNGGMYVITGPVLTDTLGSIGGANQVSIPAYFYKIFLATTPDSMYKSLAFILPNRKEKKDFKNYIVTIDSVEAFSGIDFFPALPDSIENVLEAELILEKWNYKNGRLKFGYSRPAQKCSPNP